MKPRIPNEVKDKKVKLFAVACLLTAQVTRNRNVYHCESRDSPLAHQKTLTYKYKYVYKRMRRGQRM